MSRGLGRRLGLLGVLGLFACASVPTERRAAEIVWPSEAGRSAVVARGLTPALGTEDRLLVFVEGRDAAPPVLGELEHGPDSLRFVPRFPWRRGLTYRAELAGRGVAPVRHAFPLETRAPTTSVAAVFPSATTLPENVLRFYVHFSAPMSRGEAYERVHLFDANGTELVEPFLALQQELWDPTTTRLTLLLDPGRIKRGLARHVDLGAPMQAGGAYTLVIDADWKDAQGVALTASFERRFRTEAADREQPDADGWQRTLPQAGGRDALTLDFPEALDHALLQRLVRIRAEDGELVAGQIRIERGETRWSFMPESPWRAGAYRLEIATLLEDVAGNSLERPFERVLSGLEPDAGRARWLTREFELRP